MFLRRKCTISTNIHSQVAETFSYTTLFRTMPSSRFCIFVLPKRLEEFSSLRWTSQLPSHTSKLKYMLAYTQSTRGLQSGAVLYVHKCSIHFNPLQTTPGSGLSRRDSIHFECALAPMCIGCEISQCALGSNVKRP